MNIITVKNAEGEVDTQAQIIIQNKIGYTPKVSVIIPVHNTEKYLRQCMDSVVGQTLKEIEIICVDDGSTDGSLSILKEYAEKDRRITVMAQENLHAGVARNAGLAVARGEYLSILDSDDFFEPEMLESAFSRAERTGADFVVYNSNQFDDKTKSFTNPDHFVKYPFFPGKEYFGYHEIGGNIFKSVIGWSWDKLYRAGFVERHGLRFQSQRTTNDALFVFSAIFLAERISLLDKEKRLAHHRINNSSSLENTRSMSWTCFYDMLVALRGRIIKENKFDELERDFVDYALNFSLWNLNTLPEPAASMLGDRLRNGWLHSLGITSKGADYFESKDEWRQMLVILNGNETDDYLPLLYKDFGLGCDTWSEPSSITVSGGVRAYTYDMTDIIYTRYVSWDPIKEGSCDVEIVRLSAVERRSGRVVEFPVDRIISSGKISGRRVEFRNQKCWIGCAVEGAYESLTVEAEIRILSENKTRGGIQAMRI